MNRLALVCAAFVLSFVAGCADKPVEVDLTKPMTDEVKEDYLDCEARAYRATGVMTEEEDFEARRRILIDECMSLRGYSVQE